jgi:hypothetical protein
MFVPLASDFRACFHSKLEWRNWQTHGTQNPATFTGHVGSTPTSSTNQFSILSAHVRVLDVTDGTLPLLGVRPVSGRLFTRQDDSPGAAQTVVPTYSYWQKQFGGASSVVGSSITAGGVPREIIGVLPQTFHFLDQKDPSLILPMQWDRATTTLGSLDGNAIARLKPGVSVQQATADLERLLPVVARTFPSPAGLSASFFQSDHYTPTLIPLKEEVIGIVLTLLRG